jgi:hypothetical protein
MKSFLVLTFMLLSNVLLAATAVNEPNCSEPEILRKLRELRPDPILVNDPTEVANLALDLTIGMSKYMRCLDKELAIKDKNIEANTDQVTFYFNIRGTCSNIFDELFRLTNLRTTKYPSYTREQIRSKMVLNKAILHINNECVQNLQYGDIDLHKENPAFAEYLPY